MKKILENRWVKALMLDLLGREGENPLSPEERNEYTLVAAALCAILGFASLYVSWLLAVVFYAIGLRKLHIYLRKTGRIHW